MKKEYLIFDTYIKTVSKEIKDRKVKRELKEELFSHLIEIYERNIALGMSDDDAQKDAVSHMGDTEAVAETFKKLYPVSSAEYFKYTGKLFAFVLVFSMLWLRRGITGLLGLSIWLYVALDRIKNINKTILTAYIISKINSSLYILFMIFYHNLIIDGKIMITISLILNLLIILTYILTILGLVKVRKKLGEEKSYLGLGIASIFAIIICFAIASLQAFVKESLGLALLAAFVSLLPAGLIYTITAEDIDRLETGVPQEKKTTIKNCILFIVISVIIISSMFTSKIFTYYQPIDYVIEDTKTDVSEIRNNLIDLGLPENIANELPESEILKYSNATELQINELPEDSLSESHYTSYNFILNKNDNSFVVRTLMVIDKLEDFDESSYTELFVDYYRYDSSDIYCKMLCDYDGVTKELKTLKNAPIEDDEFKDYHYIFPNTKNAENHRAYISMTVKIPASTTDDNINLKHIYAQTALDDINDPYKSYWLRDDDWLCVEFDNPYYVEIETKPNSLSDTINKLLASLTEDETIDLSELESAMEEEIGQDIDTELLEDIVNQVTDEISNP